MFVPLFRRGGSSGIRNALRRPWPEWDHIAGRWNTYDRCVQPAEEICNTKNIEIKIHPPAAPKDMADIVTAFEKVIDNIDELKSPQNHE